MRKAHQIFIASLAMLYCGGAVGEECCSSRETKSLFLKPAFELSMKDHVLLDILQEKIIGDTSALKDLKEEGGVYPEPFEQAFSYYLSQMGQDRYSRSRHFSSIYAAAQYLYHLLFPNASPTDEDSSPVVPPSSTPQGKMGDCISLLIGINYENTSSELSNCIRDIDHVLSVLLMPYLGVKHDNVIYMSDHRFGSNYYPTRANILRQFTNFASLVNQTKVGYFHYSGHGSYVRDQSGDEADRRDEAMVPVDYDDSGMLIDDEIFTALIKKLSPDVQLIVTSDCCHSGTILDLPYKWQPDGSYTVENRLNTSEFNTLPKVVMLSGCRDTQTSADGGPITVQGEGSGAFTGAFLYILRKHNYQITYRQLLVEVNRYLADNGFDQRPELTSTYLLNLDDYYMDCQRAVATH